MPRRGVERMHGVTEEDYQREIAAAREAGDNDRVNALQVARDVIDGLEFADLHSTRKLTTILASGIERANLLPSLERTLDDAGL